HFRSPIPQLERTDEDDVPIPCTVDFVGRIVRADDVRPSERIDDEDRGGGGGTAAVDVVVMERTTDRDGVARGPAGLFEIERAESADDEIASAGAVLDIGDHRVVDEGVVA